MILQDTAYLVLPHVKLVQLLLNVTFVLKDGTYMKVLV